VIHNQREKKTNSDLATVLTTERPQPWVGRRWTEKNIWRQYRGVIYDNEGKEIADVLTQRTAAALVEAHNIKERAVRRAPIIEVDETLKAISKILTSISDGSVYHVVEILPQLVELRDNIYAYKKRK